MRFGIGTSGWLLALLGVFVGCGSEGSSPSLGGAATGGGSGSGGVAAGGTGSVPSGGAPTAGTGGAPSAGTGGVIATGGVTGVDPELIDDLEDGDTDIIAQSGRTGSWFSFVDEAGQVSFSVDPGGASGSAYAVHAIGSGMTVWGGGVGLVLNGTEASPQPYDASTCRGLSFSARLGSGNSQTVRVNVSDQYTDSAAGNCTQCDDHFGTEVTVTDQWQDFAFAFAALDQTGSGDPRIALDTSALYSIAFLVGPNQPLDLLIDDVSFTSCGTMSGTGGASSGVPCGEQAVSPEFSLRWEDNFDSWNGSRWQKATHTFAENEAQFAEDAVVVEGGYLKLFLTQQRTGERDFRAGEVATNEEFQYGRFDTCVRFGRGSGIVGSFFTYTFDPWNEIDVEYLGGNPVGIQYNLIWDSGGGRQYDPTFDATRFDAADDFHSYSIEWVPGEIRFFVDGVARHSENGAGAAAMTRWTRLRMNLWPANTGFAGPFDRGAVPTESWYDWVRVYDYNG